MLHILDGVAAGHRRQSTRLPDLVRAAVHIGTGRVRLVLYPGEEPQPFERLYAYRRVSLVGGTDGFYRVCPVQPSADVLWATPRWVDYCCGHSPHGA